MSTTNWGNKLIFTFLTGFVGGIAVSSFYFVTPIVSLLLLTISVGVILAEKIIYQSLSREALIVALILLSFSIGALRYAVKDFHISRSPTNTGQVVSEPEEKENVKRFVFLSDNGEKSLVSTSLYTEINYGDKVEVKGEFKTPGIIADETTGRTFDYGKYLSKDDVYHTVSFAQVNVLESGHGNTLKRLLFKIKNNFISHVGRILQEPQASLLAGLIVAGKESLPQNILDDFKRAGVIHIVVLSGYNVTLIAEFLRRSLEKFFIFTKIPVIPQAAAGVSIVGIILFVLMTGAQATVVRAAIMAVIVIWAKLFGRTYSPSRALIFAATLMLIENPKILIFDPSFQLSFLATLGLILFQQFFYQKLSWTTVKFQVRETLAQTFATQLTVLPLLIYSTGQLSLVSIPANLLILVIVPFAMFVGFLATILSYVHYFLSWPVSFISHLLLSWILFVAHSLGSWRFAVLTIQPPGWVIVGFYLAILLVVIIQSKRKQLN